MNFRMNFQSPRDAISAPLHTAVTAAVQDQCMKIFRIPRLRLGRLLGAASLRRLLDDRIYLAPF